MNPVKYDHNLSSILKFVVAPLCAQAHILAQQGHHHMLTHSNYLVTVVTRQVAIRLMPLCQKAKALSC